MKLCLCLLLLLFSLIAKAEKPLLIPMYTPHPKYTQELLQEKADGNVSVELTILSNGSVKDISVVDSTHLGFSRIVQQALATWQFKPWSTENGQVPEITLRMPFNFLMKKSRNEFASVPLDINTALVKMKCSDVNKSFAIWNRDHRGTTLSRMRIFWHTQSYLTKGFMLYNAAEAERDVLLAALRSSLNRIVNDCRKSPDAMYADYLPEEIRRLL